jgi:hypothetical protein
LQEAGWVKLKSTSGAAGGIMLTARGLERIAELERNIVGKESTQAFVAMWFDSSLDKVWKEGFEKACTVAGGYKALRMDLKEHNQKICDAIIAEIRRSRFLVADFTGHRGGVYFEAGYALGLGIPVIWTCREDELVKSHFDTRQYNHIVWKDEQDLLEKLTRRIEATIPPFGLSGIRSPNRAWWNEKAISSSGCTCSLSSRGDTGPFNYAPCLPTSKVGLVGTRSS